MYKTLDIELWKLEESGNTELQETNVIKPTESRIFDFMHPHDFLYFYKTGGECSIAADFRRNRQKTFSVQATNADTSVQ